MPNPPNQPKKVKIHNPAVTPTVHQALRAIAARYNVTLHDLASHLISNHPLVREELGLVVPSAPKKKKTSF